MSASSSHTRPDRTSPNSEAVEDYAKAIYALARRDEGPVGTSAIAERLGVTPGTVTPMLKRMAELGLVQRVPYRGVTLAPAGEDVALEVIRHHRLLEAYLADALGMPWDKVHAEAEVLEHYISEDLEERIAAALGDPSRDPHGDPIPDRKLALESDRGGIPLTEVTAGEGGTFSRVSDSDPEMLRFLDERGIRPGAEITVRERTPFGGPLMIDVSGSEHAIGSELAERMIISD